MAAKANICFFTQTMSHTGSEVVLFNLLNNLHIDSSVTLIVKYQGELLGALPKNINKEVIYKKPVKSYTLRRIWHPIYEYLILPAKLRKHKEAIWYINSIALPEILKYAEKYKIRTIVHAHELEHFFEMLKPDELARLISYPELIIANSQATFNVFKKYGRHGKTEICYPAIDFKKIVKNKQKYSELRRQLNINEHEFVWMMCGTLDENKNPTLFIEIAAEIIKAIPDTKFVWLGKMNNRVINEECKKRTEELNIQNSIIWLGEKTSDYYDWFNIADGFVLTSQKESFSLVTLEALFLGLPLVVQDCGGVKEILRSDIGQIIELKNSAPEMAKAMIQYMKGLVKNDPTAERMRALEFDINLGSVKWGQILDRFVNSTV